MVPTNHPRQGQALPSGSPLLPASSPSPRLQGVTGSTLVLAFSSFPPGALKNPRYPCNFRCNVYLAEKRAGGELLWKKSFTHKQFEGKHVQEGYARRAVKRTEARVFWSWPTDPTSAGAQSSALFRPQRPQSNKHLPLYHPLSDQWTSPSAGETRTWQEQTNQGLKLWYTIIMDQTGMWWTTIIYPIQPYQNLD